MDIPVKIIISVLKPDIMSYKLLNKIGDINASTILSMKSIEACMLEFLQPNSLVIASLTSQEFQVENCLTTRNLVFIYSQTQEENQSF